MPPGHALRLDIRYCIGSRFVTIRRSNNRLLEKQDGGRIKRLVVTVKVNVVVEWITVGVRVMRG